MSSSGCAAAQCTRTLLYTMRQAPQHSREAQRAPPTQHAASRPSDCQGLQPRHRCPANHAAAQDPSKHVQQTVGVQDQALQPTGKPNAQWLPRGPQPPYVPVPFLNPPSVHWTRCVVEICFLSNSTRGPPTEQAAPPRPALHHGDRPQATTQSSCHHTQAQQRHRQAALAD